jgi:hypothetical protein
VEVAVAWLDFDAVAAAEGVAASETRALEPGGAEVGDADAAGEGHGVDGVAAGGEAAVEGGALGRGMVVHGPCSVGRW